MDSILAAASMLVRIPDAYRVCEKNHWLYPQLARTALLEVVSCNLRSLVEIKEQLDMYNFLLSALRINATINNQHEIITSTGFHHLSFGVCNNQRSTMESCPQSIPYFRIFIFGAAAVGFVRCFKFERELMHENIAPITVVVEKCRILGSNGSERLTDNNMFLLHQCAIRQSNKLDMKIDTFIHSLCEDDQWNA